MRMDYELSLLPSFYLFSLHADILFIYYHFLGTFNIYFYWYYTIYTDHTILSYDIITKLPESGVLCDNITEFGVAEDHLSP